MKNRRYVKHLVVALTAALVAVSIGLVARGGNAHGDTTTGTLVGEGGDAMTPVMLSLLSDDASQLLPDTASYTNVNLNQAISDFVGTAPGSFGADFAVSERALTTAEAAQATADGRSYAYVPFAATPDALMTLVPNSTYNGGNTITASQFCQHIPLTLTQLDGIYGEPQDTDWSALTCPASSTGTSTTTTTGASTTTTTAASTTSTTTASSTKLDAQPIVLYGNADPTMENFDLMTLLDSTSASQTAYGDLLTKLSGENRADSTNPAATETWPFPSTAVVGGDEATLGKIVGLVPRTGAPSTEVAQLQLGAIMPVASVWTGDPLGVPWNLPTAAVQNAQGSLVAPSTAAAQAAESDVTLASNNIVSFNADMTDATAYNNDLMLESYLVVPTNGLSSDKALALAQLVRFVLGSEGQKDIEALGAAPATTAMVTAGLQVAQQLDVEAATTADATAADCSTTTTTSSTTPSTSTTTTSSSSTTTTSSPTTTTTTTPTSGSTTTTTAPCTTTTTTSGSTTTGSTTTVPNSTICPPTATTTTTTIPSTSTSTTNTSPSTSTTSTSPSTSTTTTSPSTSTTTSPSTSTTTTSTPTSTTTTSESTTTTSTSSPTTTTTSESTTTTTAADQSTTTTIAADADTSTTSTSPSTSTTSTSPSTTTTTGPSTTTTTAPSTTTTTICPTTTATTAVPTSDDGGSPSDLAFTGMNPVPLVGLGFLLFILGEIGLRSLRKRLGRQ